MPEIPQLIDPPSSLEDDFPAETANFYDQVLAHAASHTGPDKLFSLLETDVKSYPFQDVDVQYVPSLRTGIDECLDIAESVTPGITHRAIGLKERYPQLVDDVQKALADGFNVIEAVPTHSLVHDIALPQILLTKGMEEESGDTDNPENRHIILAKSLGWYAYHGLPAVDVISNHNNVFFSIPPTESGDSYDPEFQHEFNRRMMHQLGMRLEEGGQRLVIATSAATNIRTTFHGRTLAEYQKKINDGTIALLRNDQNLVLPEACYLDERSELHVAFGSLRKLKSDEECVELGIWGARSYFEMSGIPTWQLRTRPQAKKALAIRGEELISELRRSRVGQAFRRLLSPENIHEEK